MHRISVHYGSEGYTHSSYHEEDVVPGEAFDVCMARVPTKSTQLSHASTPNWRARATNVSHMTFREI